MRFRSSSRLGSFRRSADSASRDTAPASSSTAPNSASSGATADPPGAYISCTAERRGDGHAMNGDVPVRGWALGKGSPR